MVKSYICPCCKESVSLDRLHHATNAEMERRYKEGQTLSMIGAAFGVSRERVRQILRRRAVRPDAGGSKLFRTSKSARTEALALQKQENRALADYGCTWQEYREVAGINNFVGHNQTKNKLLRAYWQHKHNARRTGIPWGLSLPAYAKIVEPHLGPGWRGRLVLSRKDKSKGFSPENTEVITLSESSRRVQSARRPGYEEKRAAVYHLWKAGKTPTEIAKITGISRYTAAQWCYAFKNMEKISVS